MAQCAVTPGFTPSTSCRQTPVATSISCGSPEMIASGSGRRMLACLWIASALSASLTAHARVYLCEDATGRIILRDVPCKRGEVTRQQEAAPKPAPAAQPVEQKTIVKPQQKLTE